MHEQTARYTVVTRRHLRQAQIAWPPGRFQIQLPEVVDLVA